MNTIQGNLVPLELSFDSGSTWQILVCLKQYNMPTTLPTTVTDTFCGPAVGVGNITFNPAGEAVCDSSPTAGSQVTYNRLLTAQVNKETIMFRSYSPGSGSTGNTFFLKGNCKVTDLNLTIPAADLIAFTFTLTGEGTLDIAYP